MKIEIRKRERGFYKRAKRLIKIIDKIINSYDLPWTVRQIHYKLVSLGEINNILNDYQTVSRTLRDARYSGLISWEKIIDDTRSARKTSSYENIEKGIDSFLEDFRLNGRWAEKKHRVEVWAEKRALQRSLFPITDKYDVYLVVGGGFNSLSAIWEAVKRITRYNAERLDIIYLGDLDPSGDDMPRDIEDRLNDFSGLALTFSDDMIKLFPNEIHVHKILLTEGDIDKYHLKKKFDVPVKKGNKVYNKIKEDPRAKNFYKKYGEIFQVEIEALPPNVIVDILENELIKYVDEEKMKQVSVLEEKEINRIKELIK